MKKTDHTTKVCKSPCYKCGLPGHRNCDCPNPCKDSRGRSQERGRSGRTPSSKSRGEHKSRKKVLEGTRRKKDRNQGKNKRNPIISKENQRKS